MHQVSYIKYHVSGIKYQVSSSIRYQLSNTSIKNAKYGSCKNLVPKKFGVPRNSAKPKYPANTVLGTAQPERVWYFCQAQFQL